MRREELSSLLKSARDIMRKDRNLDTDVKRIPTLAWLFFLKCFDDLERRRETEAVLKGKTLRRSIEKPYRWRDWAADEAGITGDELLEFINNKLFPYLKGLTGTTDRDQRDVISALFREITNEARSGYLLRDVINLVNKINFNSSDDIHTLSHIYESMLRELRDAAGQNGEFYTPRPVVRFIVEMIAPKLGETILDPAGGTCGFLVESYEYLKKQQEKAEDRDLLQYRTLYGVEKKPMPYLLGTMNLLLHGIERPNYTEANSLAVNLNDITDSRRYDIIITNPPFGGEEEAGIKSGFPQDKQTSETALLFLQFIMRSLCLPDKARNVSAGRCGMVIPNSTLSGTGVYTRIKEELIQDFNLHTIVRLPEGVFAPYTDIPTNLLFFDRSGPTKVTWYYSHPLPPDRQKLKNPRYTKTRPVMDADFEMIRKWWSNRKENEYAWQVPVEKIVENNYNLDFKNPNTAEGLEYKSPGKLIMQIAQKEKHILEVAKSIETAISSGKLNISKNWTSTVLGKILTQRTEKPDLYKIATGSIPIVAKIGFDNGKIELRSDTKTRTNMILIRPGDLVLSGINAAKGAIALYSEKESRCIAATIHYSSYYPNKKRVNLRFLWRFLRSSVFRHILRDRLPGGIKTELKANRFLQISIPLPPLEEQRHVIDLLAKADKLRHTHSETQKDLDALTQCILSKAFKGEL